MSHYRILRERSNTVKCIGMTMWSTINEETRLELKIASDMNKPRREICDDAQEDKEVIERNHTHCILFDSGRLNEHLSDSQRDQFVAVACKNKNSEHICMYADRIPRRFHLNIIEVML